MDIVFSFFTSYIGFNVGHVHVPALVATIRIIIGIYMLCFSDYLQTGLAEMVL